VAQAAVISTAYATTRISAPITAAAFHTRQTLDSTDLRHWTAGNAFMTLYHPMEGLSLSPRFCSSTVRKHPLPKTRTTSLGARGGRTWRIPPWHFVQIRQHAFQTRSSKAFRGHQSHFAAAQPPDAPSTRTATPRTRTAPQWFTNPTKILTPLVGRGTKTPMAGRLTTMSSSHPSHQIPRTVMLVHFGCHQVGTGIPRV
jgi:hypothetical protein